MNRNPLKAYKNIEKATISGRATEARVLNKAAQKLKYCQDNWMSVSSNNKDRLEKALRFNQRIWSIFQSELARDENPLPVNLKRDILSLSAFIDKRIFEIMACPEKEKLTALIKINQNIAAGLS